MTCGVNPMNCDMSEFMEAFFEDAREHLAMMEQGLLGLEADPQNIELVDGIFRGAHTIKGNSLMLSLNEIANLTHVLESLLDRMRAKTIAVLPEYVSVLLHATDVLGSLLRAAKGEGEPSTELATVTEQLHQVLEANGADAAPETFDAAGYCAEATAKSGKSVVEVPADRDEVHDASATACEQTPEPPRLTASESAQKKSAAKSGGAAHTEASSIRVSIDKVDELINLVGELAIAQSMVNQAIRDLPIEIAPMLEEAMAAMERSTREVQERVMSVRMLPVGTIFRRFPRVVRDLSSSLGKKVELEIVGEETELDKQVIEQISDPLTHLIRNAIDHGIESPEERLASGKPEEGTLRLVAFHEGGNVIIDVAENGRGLDAIKIRNKALSLGLIGPNETLTEEESQSLIFRPGFSTASAVSDVSGRGVGMDVVKRNIESLNGSVSIKSEAGRGTRFRIKLPLTMAILDGLSVSIDGEVYILPLLSVVESFRPKLGELRSVLGGGELLVVRGESVPLLRLNQTFGINGGVTNPSEGLVVIVENQGRKVGLLVDELLGQLQVVMKSVEEHYEKVDGICGATILGDGRVALIIDIGGVDRLSRLTFNSTATFRDADDCPSDLAHIEAQTSLATADGVLS